MIAEVVEVLKLSLSINKLGISERTVQDALSSGGISLFYIE